MKYILLLFILCSVANTIYAEDRFISQIKIRHKNCPVEYWNNNGGTFTGYWTQLEFSICGDWSRAIYYKHNLVIEGHFVGDDLCDWYSVKHKCFIINSYYVPKKVIGFDCSCDCSGDR